MNALIRPARAADAPRIADLSQQLGYPMTLPQAVQRLGAVLAHAEHLVLAAEDTDGRVIGWLHARYCLEIVDDPLVEVLGLVVDEPRRNAGAGSGLLRATEAWALERGVTKMRVRSRATRDGARRFYEERGFRLDKRQNVFKRELRPAR